MPYGDLANIGITHLFKYICDKHVHSKVTGPCGLDWSKYGIISLIVKLSSEYGMASSATAVDKN